jgi:hypothetical protein
VRPVTLAVLAPPVLLVVLLVVLAVPVVLAATVAS